LLWTWVSILVVLNTTEETDVLIYLFLSPTLLPGFQPVFWYFVTMELVLQSTRMFVHGMTASPSSILGTIAGLLPSPFSDAILVFMRYRLIWTSMLNDLSVVVFIVGLTIAFSHMFS